MEKFERQVKQFPIELKIGPTVQRVTLADRGFSILYQDGGSAEARCVIVASGKRPRPLDVPGEERLRGRGVSYCAVCDGPLFGGVPVVVVGGGNSAFEAANDMVKIASHVHVVSVTPFTADPVLIEKLQAASNITAFPQARVLSIEGDLRVERVTIEDMKSGQARTIDAGGVFVEIGLIPNSDMVKGLVELNDKGEIKVNCLTETGVPGLYAAGDVTDVPEKQIVVSAGEGAKAALQAHRYLQRLRYEAY